jgi:peptide/nickel transport system ATP-binding protein
MTPLLELRNVSKVFGGGGFFHQRRVTALNDFSIAIEGEPPTIIAVVGESGSGKSTMANLLLGLEMPTEGTVLYKGTDLRRCPRQERRAFRRDVQAIFQDPFGVYNSFYKVDHVLTTPIAKFKLAKSRQEARKLIEQALLSVGLRPEETLGRYPHQLSGGQRQRISVARALTVNPSFIVADEAVSMVDVSIRISLLKTLSKLKEQMGLAVLFITHDLALAKYFAWEGRIGVMYLGRIVELAPARELVDNPQHPYTQVLLSAIPEANPDVTRRKQPIALRSMDVPSLLQLPSGCAFHPRCPRFEGAQCENLVPKLIQFDDGTAVACHPAARTHATAISAARAIFGR